MKISKIQLEILKLMKKGWELGKMFHTDLSVRFWLQKEGIGKGGETKEIRNSKSIFKLEDLSLIKLNQGNPSYFSGCTYKLTEKGKEFLQSIGG